jgi:hypothetical protein
LNGLGRYGGSTAKPGGGRVAGDVDSTGAGRNALGTGVGSETSGTDAGGCAPRVAACGADETTIAGGGATPEVEVAVGSVTTGTGADSEEDAIAAAEEGTARRAPAGSGRRRRQS